MAFDYGSIDLGLKNPFKLEGTVKAIRGLIQSGIGLFLLISASSRVETNLVIGWIFVVFGALILSAGIRALANGIYANFRYFVGRNHPTSLASNFSASKNTTAQEEADIVAYNADQLEEMLVGRKNATFVEPIGFLARLVHSFFPKLLFLPYPMRNMAQTLFGAWISTFTSLFAYALVAFVTLSGFAGETGKLTFPIYSALLLVYVVVTWHSASKPISRAAQKKIQSLGGQALVKIITLSLMVPILIGISVSWLVRTNTVSNTTIKHWISLLSELTPMVFLVVIFTFATVSTALITFMLRKRLASVHPVSEVSELRENWQESVHPNEIFINLDSLVMANRRYKEVPNRVYRELDPLLQEQVQGKGDFSGKMIQEVQPRVAPLDLGTRFIKVRQGSLLVANALFIIASLVTLFFTYSVVDIYKEISQANIGSTSQLLDALGDSNFKPLLISSMNLFLIGLIVKIFGQLLGTVTHLFFAEIQFESLLIYFKCEGTFTESKISTGTGIHDSTRSENTLVRSSITPWVIASRIISTTFAATGIRNLEHPRHILEMHKDDMQLQAIKEDIVSFLKDRESIASITSARDIGNASQIHQLNEQTRALNQSKSDSDSVGYLQQEQDFNKPNNP